VGVAKRGGRHGEMWTGHGVRSAFVGACHSSSKMVVRGWYSPHACIHSLRHVLCSGRDSITRCAVALGRSIWQWSWLRCTGGPVLAVLYCAQVIMTCLVFARSLTKRASFEAGTLQAPASICRLPLAYPMQDHVVTTILEHTYFVIPGDEPPT
jgi:hypothetical protein